MRGGSSKVHETKTKKHLYRRSLLYVFSHSTQPSSMKNELDDFINHRY
jgi:hypothetical protein